MKLVKYIFLFFIFINILYAQNNNTKVKLQLKWKHQFQSAGFIAAVEKGFYKDVGLEVEMLEFTADTKVLDSIKSNKVQFAVTDTSIILNKMEGEPIQAIMATFQRSPHILLGLKSLGVKSIQDLNGKKIAMVDELNGLELSAMLRANNIEYINKPAIFTFEKLFSKEIDFMTAYISNEPFVAKEKNIEITTFFPGDYGYDGYGDIVFTSEYMVQTNPDIVQKMYEASKKGWQYAYEHKKEMVDIIYNKYNTLNKSKEALLYEAETLEKISGYKEDKLGDINIDKVKSIGKLFSFLIKQHININNLDDFIYKPDLEGIYLTKNEKDFIKNNPKIVIGTGDSWPPYSMKKSDGTLIGLDVDIINKINQLTGANFVLQQGDWKRIQQLAKEKKIDGLATLIQTKEREEFLNFSDIYFTIQKMVLVKQRNPLGIKSPKDLDGKTIIVHRGNIADKIEAEKFKNSKITYAETTVDMLKAVIYGDADATFGNGALEYTLIKEGLPYLENAFGLDQYLNIRFAVRKDWPEAVSIINKALKYIGNDELYNIKLKWFSMNNTDKIKMLIFTPEEKSYLDLKQTVKMCTDPNWMPFEQINEGKYIGMGADYIELINKKLPVDIQLIKTKSWSESLEFIQNGRCDILPLAMRTPQREKYLNFTTPYLSVPIVLATKSEEPFITDFKEIEGKKIGVPKGYALVDIFKKSYPYFQIVEVDNVHDGLKKVYNNELFGYVGSLAAIAYQFQNNFASGLKISGKFDETFDLSIAVAKNQLPLIHIFQKALNSIDENQKRKIFNKWVAISYEKDIDYGFVWKIVSVVFVILSVILYWNIRLKNEIRKRKIAEKELQELNSTLEIKIQEAVKDVRAKEKILQQQSKLASMGQMISNIAHQWRQPLAVSNTIVSILKEKQLIEALDKNYTIKKLNEIESANLYMSQTIEDFLSFFKPSKKKERFNVFDAVTSSLNIVKNLINEKNIEVEIKVPETLELTGFKDEFSQVIIAILTNSIDALKNKDGKKR